VSGFFAVPYTIVVYPLIFVFMPRLWSVSHRNGYVTPADFVRGRYDSRLLSLAIALTGIVATMPYIALQLVGIQAVVDTMGLGGTGNTFVKDLPLIIAFVVLAAYTYSSGLRAPALIAFVKDTLIYLVIIVAVVYVAWKIGFGNIFDAAQKKLTTPAPPTNKPPGVFIPSNQTYWAYTTLALGSAMALFMYPHSVTGVLAAGDRKVIRRNAAILPSYSLMLGFLALLGFAAIYKKTSIVGQDGKPNTQLVVPHFFAQVFPDWFAGIALAAIGIGALVPAAIMSIAAANLFTRNIYRDFFRPLASPREEATVSKIASLVVKFGALAFVLSLDRQNALNFQLLGGVWIMQTFLAIVAGLYTRWFHRWALLLGWGAAMAYGTYEAYGQASTATKHFGSSLATFPFTDTKVYIAVSAIVINIIVSVVVTVLLRLLRVPAGADATDRADYLAEAASPAVTRTAQRTTAGAEAGSPG
jgi:SSS family solute:Na+ symporter